MVKLANAFTQANDLAWNPQTLFRCQSTKGMLSYYQENVNKIGDSVKKHQTTIHLEEKDREAIAAIREHFGVLSDAAAIRMALRELHRQITLPITPRKDSLISP